GAAGPRPRRADAGGARAMAPPGVARAARAGGRLHGADHAVPPRAVAASLRTRVRAPADPGHDRPAVGAGAARAAGTLMDYLVLKWVHILSSTILFGAGVGSAFHMFVSTLRREVDGMANATRNVVIADWVLTTPTAILQPATGL